MTDLTQQKHALVTACERADLDYISDQVMTDSWPEFMRHSLFAERYRSELYAKYPEYQFALVHSDTGEVLVSGNSIPLAWEEDFEDLPDGGLEWALEKAFADREAGRAPTVLCALFIAVVREYRGRGLGYPAIQAAKTMARSHGLGGMIAPVRPVFKSRYPMTPINRYIRWRNSRGIPLDAWLSAFVRSGAEIVKVCSNSVRIIAPIADWERWTKMRFPESSIYVVPGALVPIRIDRQKGTGTYIEPNVWMVCRLEK